MSNYIIVSRHPAAIEFIRATDPRFREAPVLESATADDVRGAVVAGNLPLHLAAAANAVVAVEFSGPPPRGQEYTLADMEAAGARLQTYRVERVAAPAREIKYSDKRQPRGLRPLLVVGRGDAIYKFAGETIPGVVAVVSSRYQKNGRWSGTDYVLRLHPAAAWALYVPQGWEEPHLYFDNPQNVADVLRQFRRAGCIASDAAIIAFLEREFPNTLAQVREREQALASVE